MRSFWLAKNKSVLDCLLAESSSIVCLHVVTEAASQCSGINKQTQRKRSPKGQLGVKFKPFSKFPPCYKNISFWINESFTENNLCEVLRGMVLTRSLNISPSRAPRFHGS
ncbi:uncharacterized protein LOC130713679 isoform X2 [Lotus japonicus]|nr:uncharacterized protein LOC130713679 isoform X2 [Lotus japonicus]XP_057419452.1 uncharacterized protein LOC130713679 isoform X2 [Lotus japonicus]XP_057419453.1 uncharacterized protein LOC130713679 isoform X2 [Lotus japonicus]XP_057419454.1 uncharacterized protein LOC130713679 isoform X2 [Lotus japonicus]